MRQDLRAFEQFQAMQHFPKVKAVVDRSVFHLVSAQQLVGMCQDNAWELRQPLRDWLTAANTKNIASLVCEDAFHFAKVKIDKQNSHKGREARAFGVLLEKEVLTATHRYEDVQASLSSGSRTAKLDTAAYRPAMKDTNVCNLRKVIGSSPGARPGWYSPGVDSLAVEHLDLGMMRWCERHNMIEQCGHAWLGCLVTGEHQIMVRTVVNGVRSGWFFALLDVPGTCSIVWPASSASMPTKPMQKYFTFQEGVPDVNELFLPIVDLDCVEAMSYTWRSPLWRAKAFPKSKPSDWATDGCIAVPVSEPESLLKVACKQAFWSMGVTSLALLSSHVGAPASSKKSLYDMLFGLIRHVLQVPDEEVVHLLAKRLGGDAATNYMNDLLELDEAYEVVDADERKECEKERDRQRASKAEATSFRKVYSEQRALILSAATNKRAKNKQKAKAKAMARTNIPDGELCQAQLRPMCPPGGYIWRCNAAGGGWQAHFKPFRRVAFSSSIWGPRHSGILCLRYLWDAWCTMNGEQRPSVPIIGLYAEGAAEEVLPGAPAAPLTGSSNDKPGA